MSLLIVPLPADSEVSESALQRTMDEFLLIFNQHLLGKHGTIHRPLEDVVIVPWRASDWSGQRWKESISDGQLLLGDVENEKPQQLFEQNFQTALDRLLIRRQRRNRSQSGLTEQILIVPIMVHTTLWSQEGQFQQDIKYLTTVRDTIDRVCQVRARLGLNSEDARATGLELQGVRYVPWLYFQKSVPLEKLPEEIFRAPEGLFDGNEDTVESAYPFIQVGRTIGGQLIQWDGLGSSRLFNDLLLLWTLSQLGEGHPQNLFSRFDTKMRDRWILQSNSALFDVPLAESIKRKRLHSLIESGHADGTGESVPILPSMSQIRHRAETYMAQWTAQDNGEQQPIQKATEKPPPEPIGKTFVSAVLQNNMTVDVFILQQGYRPPTPKFKERSIIPQFLKQIWMGQSEASSDSPTESSEEYTPPIPLNDSKETFTLNKPSSENWQEYVTEKWSVLSPKLQADAFAIKVYTILQNTNEKQLSEKLDEILQNIQKTINERIDGLEKDLSSFSTGDEDAVENDTQTSDDEKFLYNKTLEKLARTLASIQYLQYRLRNIEEKEEREEQPDARTQLLELREKWLKEEEALLEAGARLPSMGGIMLEVGAAITALTAVTFGVGFPLGLIFGLSKYNVRIKELNHHFSEWENFEQRLVSEANELSKVFSERVDYQVKQLRSMMLLEMRQSLVAIEKRLLVELNGFIAYVNQEYARLVRKVNFRNSYSEVVGRFSYRPDEDILSRFSFIDDNIQREFYKSLYANVLKKSIKLSKIPIPATLDEHESVLRKLVESEYSSSLVNSLKGPLQDKIEKGLREELEKAWYYSQNQENFSVRNISTQDLEEFHIQRCNFAIIGEELSENSRFKFREILSQVFADSGTEPTLATSADHTTNSLMYATSDISAAQNELATNIYSNFPAEIGLFTSISMLHIKVNPEQGQGQDATTQTTERPSTEPTQSDVINTQPQGSKTES